MPSSTRRLVDRLTEATRRSLVDDGRHHPVTGFPSSTLCEVQEAVTEADGVIAVTPILTASYSGLFKSFFDVIDNDVLIGKPALIAATGGTARHSLALEHALRPLFGYLRADRRADRRVRRLRGPGRGREERHRRPRRPDQPRRRRTGGPDGRPSATAPAETVIPFAQQLAALRPA